MFKYHEKGASNTLLKSSHSIIIALGRYYYTIFILNSNHNI